MSLERTLRNFWGTRLGEGKRPRRGESLLSEALRAEFKDSSEPSLRTGQKFRSESERDIPPEFGF
jgi:hypothetical protein